MNIEIDIIVYLTQSVIGISLGLKMVIHISMWSIILFNLNINNYCVQSVEFALYIF